MATPAEITEADACFNCIEDKWSAALYLLNGIREAQGGAAMTAAEVAEAAATNCWQCIDDRWSAALYLLEQILAGGGGGGGSGVVSSGAVDPVAAPADPAVDNWYINTVAGTGWLWPAGGAAWQQIV